MKSGMPLHEALAVLTRPAGRNESLAALLGEQGVPSLCLPALSLSLNEQAVGDWVAPQGYDLIVFVSGHAAASYLQCWERAGAARQWPQGVAAATVGAASARPLLDAGWIPAGRVIHPPADVPQDSESLWRQLQARTPAPRRVLIVGSHEGRDWLRRQFLGQGCRVDRFAVYERKPASWKPEQAEPLRLALEQGRRIACLLTSAQGVDAFDANLRALGLTMLYAQGRFAAIHERVASRLQWQAQHAGCGDIHVELCMPDDPAIAAAIMRLLAS